MTQIFPVSVVNVHNILYLLKRKKFVAVQEKNYYPKSVYPLPIYVSDGFMCKTRKARALRVAQHILS